VGDGFAAPLTSLARFLFGTGSRLFSAATISEALRRRIIRFVAGSVLIRWPPSAVSRVPDGSGDARCAYEEGKEATNGSVLFGSPSCEISSAGSPVPSIT